VDEARALDEVLRVEAEAVGAGAVGMGANVVAALEEVHADETGEGDLGVGLQRVGALHIHGEQQGRRDDRQAGAEKLEHDDLGKNIGAGDKRGALGGHGGVRAGGGQSAGLHGHAVLRAEVQDLGVHVLVGQRRDAAGDHADDRALAELVVAADGRRGHVDEELYVVRLVGLDPDVLAGELESVGENVNVDRIAGVVLAGDGGQRNVVQILHLVGEMIPLVLLLGLDVVGLVLDVAVVGRARAGAGVEASVGGGELQVVLSVGGVERELGGDGGDGLVDELLREAHVARFHINDAALLLESLEHLLVVEVDAALDEDLLEATLHVFELFLGKNVVLNTLMHNLYPP